MRNFCSLCLLLCPAGLAHATLVYSTATSDAPATSVARQILNDGSGASDYALEMADINMQQIRGDFVLDSRPFFSSLEKNVLATIASNGAPNGTSNGASNGLQEESQIPEDGNSRNSPKESNTFGIAGFALLGLGKVRWS